MMLPHPFQMMMIGGAINEWQNADQMEHLKKVEQHAGQLEHRLKSTIDGCQCLGEAFIQLQEYAASIEGERDQLQDQLSVVMEYFMKLHADFKEVTLEFERVKETAARWEEENLKKLQFYEQMKKILTKLSVHADKAFKPEFTTAYGEKLAKFVEQLPE